MAQGQKLSDEELLVQQLAGVHLDAMDESDDYVPHQQTHQQAQVVQPQVTTGNPAMVQQANVAATVKFQDIGVSGPQQLPPNVAAPDQSYVNPSATPQGQHILAFFGGYSTKETTGEMDKEKPGMASKASFCSLQPGKPEAIPSYACRSDPRYMSTVIDPQYTLGVRNENEFLALFPNIYNPQISLPMNVTPDKTIAIYETLHHIRAEKKQQEMAAKQEKEERALYGGSTQQIAPASQMFSHNLVTGYQNQHSLPVPPVVPAQIPAVIPASVVADPIQSASVGTAYASPHVNPPVHNAQQQSATASQPTTPMINIPNPDNPVLKAALYQAMRQETSPANAGLNMDDLRNVMLNQDIAINPKTLKKEDEKGSDSTIGSGSSSSSQCRRRPRCTIL